MENSAEINADIAIVGSGMAGGTLACLLGGLGLRVALIDRAARAARLDPGYDGRSTAISYGSARIMAAAGVWEALLPHGSPIEQIRIADGTAPLFLQFDHAQVEGKPFGWIVENALIRRALEEGLATLPSVQVLSPAQVVGYQADGRARLALADGRSIAAALAIGADGRESTLRNLAGIAATRRDYGQTALAFPMRHEHPHQQVAVEHFQPAGPFAVLPMVDDGEGRHRSSVVWSLENDRAAEYLALDEAAFTTALQAMCGDYWGRVELAGQRFAYPLKLVQAARYTAPRLALAGEAAHAIHPIAGQGLNLSLRDIALLAELIADTARLGLDIGAPRLLAAYAAQRRGDTQRLVLATDGLNRLFSNDLLPVRLLRDAGLAMVEQLPGLKKFFMLTAMGTALNPPRLVKGDAL
jgi:2-octaprenyl-6-methoxyphenol hydroxylase